MVPCVPDIAIVSYTSDIPHSRIGNQIDLGIFTCIYACIYIHKSCRESSKDHGKARPHQGMTI